MKQKKILVVEDDSSIIKALVNKLGAEGFDVFDARNGEEGLATALKEKPDAILLDILMPKVDGIEMLKRLREDKWGKDVKVFILTNFDSTEKEKAAKELGVRNYIIKSDLNIHDIVKIIRE